MLGSEPAALPINGIAPTIFCKPARTKVSYVSANRLISNGIIFILFCTSKELYSIAWDETRNNYSIDVKRIYIVMIKIGKLSYLFFLYISIKIVISQLTIL